MPVVSHAHGFAFVANPKAASTSVQSVLNRYQEREDLDRVERPGYFTRRHLPAVDLKEILGPATWGRMFTFGVIRNPFSWMASQLTYNLTRLGLEVPRHRSLGPADVMCCYEILKDAKGQPASPTGTQWAFLCDRDRRPVVARLFTLDRLADNWPCITSLVNAQTLRLPMLNSSSHPPWTGWLSKAARLRIEQIWKDDLELYAKARLNELK
jgi:hypothetical protein